MSDPLTITYDQVLIDCPYCNQGQKMWTKGMQRYQPHMYLCDIDQGGCDKWFAVRVKTHIIKMETMAIEGQQDIPPSPQDAIDRLLYGIPSAAKRTILMDCIAALAIDEEVIE